MNTTLRKDKYIIDTDVVNGYRWTDIVNTETDEVITIEHEM